MSSLAGSTKAGSLLPANSPSSNVPVEYLELADGRVSFECFLIVAGFDNDRESLEGFRGGTSGVTPLRSWIGSSGVCWKGPWPCCQRMGSACIAAISSGGSGMRGEYWRIANGGVD